MSEFIIASIVIVTFFIVLCISCKYCKPQTIAYGIPIDITPFIDNKNSILKKIMNGIKIVIKRKYMKL